MDPNIDGDRVIPSTVLLGVCMCIASNPEPLHTLSARMRTLAALSATCREIRGIVSDFAVPALQRAYVPPSPHPVEEIPTVESLVRRTDYELMMFEEVLCTRPRSDNNNYTRPRGTRVDCLLQLGQRGGALWRLVGLKGSSGPAEGSKCRPATRFSRSGSARRTSMAWHSRIAARTSPTSR